MPVTESFKRDQINVDIKVRVIGLLDTESTILELIWYMTVGVKCQSYRLSIIRTA